MKFDEYAQYRETQVHEQPGFPYNTYLCTIPLDFDSVAPHWHDQMEIIYVKKGQGFVSLGFERHPVCAGSIVVVPPGEIHAIEGDGRTRMEYENIIFSLSILGGSSEDVWFRHNILEPLQTNSISLPYPLPTEGKMYAEVKAALDASDRACEKRLPGYSLIVRSNLILLLHALFIHGDIRRPTNKKAASAHIKNVLIYLREHYNEPLSIKDVANIAGYSKAHLMRSFKQETGQSFVSYLTDYRLTAASHLLRRTQEPVTAIAASCGFESLSYFIRKFKTRYGISPGTYRKQRTGTEIVTNKLLSQLAPDSQA